MLRMTSETAFLQAMRVMATSPASRGLLDDAAVIELGDATLVLTHDMLVEGVHFLASDPPGDVAWKLVAVNLSDLAAKGARPVGALLGYSLGEAEWDRAFVAGLAAALGAFGIALLGGDTVAMPQGSARAFGLTAIGRAERPVPSRSGAAAGDVLWVTGTIGDAGAGLRIAKGEIEGPAALADRYRRPRPRLEAGRALAPLVTAMMDVSDGLLIDAARMASASGSGLEIDLALVPLSADYIALMGDHRSPRLTAAGAGDDYELLFAASVDRSAELLGLAGDLGLPLSRIGQFASGAGLRLVHGGEPVALPERLGWEHISV